MKRLAVFHALLAAVVALGGAVAWAQSRLPLDTIRLPAGFSISLYASGVDGAREMDFAPNGTLYIGSTGGTVYAALPDGTVLDVARGLRQPVGVAYRDGSLFVSAVSSIYRIDGIDRFVSSATRGDLPKPTLVTNAYPGDAHHGWKFIKIGPDGKLYVPVGVPCNICARSDRPYGTITRIGLDGSGFQIVAKGVRNSVGFDWNPADGSLWFTDNGRDYLGDTIPPDELNRAPVAGLDFGFPFVYDAGTPDPEYGKQAPPGFAPTAPAAELQAHVAPLGMRFYTGTMFPASYRGQIFIAEHGSWNRSVPIGYRVALVRLDSSGARAISTETFAEGWLSGGRVWGRPADVEVGPDGALYVSDDLAGVVYRIRYTPGP